MKQQPVALMYGVTMEQGDVPRDHGKKTSLGSTLGMGMLVHTVYGSRIRTAGKGIARLYAVMQGLKKKGTAGEGESWCKNLVWVISNGEL